MGTAGPVHMPPDLGLSQQIAALTEIFQSLLKVFSLCSRRIDMRVDIHIVDLSIRPGRAKSSLSCG